MHIQTNFSLKNYNTFGIEAKAKQFVSVSSIAELKEVLTKNDDIFDKLDETRVQKIVTMVNDAVFGQIFISDTHAERTEMIIKETHQSYKIFQI